MGLRSIPVNRALTSTKRSCFSGFTFPVISSGAELFILPRNSTSARLVSCEERPDTRPPISVMFAE